MLKEEIRPSSIEGIKRLAKQIRKQKGIPHSTALDLASRSASFENFTHARRSLEAKNYLSGSSHQLFLTIYWHNMRPYRSGRETIEIRLSCPLVEICNVKEMKLDRFLGGMRLVAPDHLVMDSLAQSRESSQEHLCKTVRTLRFMEATGLKPSSRRVARRVLARLDKNLPQKDHSTNWFDPKTGQFVLLDEPYSDGEISIERADWAFRNKWNIRSYPSMGLYSPDTCPLFVASPIDGKMDFEELMHRIGGMAIPLVLDQWDGVSVEGHETFVSPLASTPQDRRRARAKGTGYQEPSKTTEPYSSQWFSRRKPVGAMGISQHQEAGRMIKALLASRSKPWSVNDRLETLRCTLEDWLGLEISKKDLPGPEFFDVYYHDVLDSDPFVKAAETSDGVIDLLQQLREKLTRFYPDCAPLRRLTGRIDTAVNCTMLHRNNCSVKATS